MVERSLKRARNTFQRVIKIAHVAWSLQILDFCCSWKSNSRSFPKPGQLYCFRASKLRIVTKFGFLEKDRAQNQEYAAQLTRLTGADFPEIILSLIFLFFLFLPRIIMTSVTHCKKFRNNYATQAHSLMRLNFLWRQFLWGREYLFQNAFHLLFCFSSFLDSLWFADTASSCCRISRKPSRLTSPFR